MGDPVMRSGDQAIFDTQFGAATVIAPPGVLTGTSRAKVDGATVCIAGDESSVVVVASYSAPPYAGGVGTLMITSLGGDQTAQKASSTRVPVILRGSRFNAMLTVTTPATAPNGSLDTTPIYSGGGTFTTTNSKTSAI